MSPSDAQLVQLVTRIPYSLRRRAKLHCTERDITLNRFVVEAICDRLDERERGRARRLARRRIGR